MSDVNPEQASDQIRNIKISIEKLRQDINVIGNCREKALALTKLDECEMWVNKGWIMLNSVTPPPVTIA